MANRSRFLSLRSDRVLLLAAGLVFAVGALIYIVDRPSDTVYFMPDEWRREQVANTVFGPFGSFLPTFAHTFVFSVLTAMVVPRTLRSAAMACAFWMVVGGVFEVGQSDVWAIRITHVTPGWFMRVPLLENVPGYFMAGQFDSLDLVSIIAGALAAYVCVISARRLD
jgi:hypothetical protein